MDVDPAPAISPSSNAVTRFRNRIVRFFLRFNLSEQSFLISLAILVGVGCGAGSVLFQWLLDVTHRLLLVDARAFLGEPFLFPLIPAIGGLAAGLIACFYAAEARGPGVAEVMNAIVTRRGVIRARVMVAKAFASAFTLGSGGSAGSEGPIIQIGAAWGSSVGRLFRFSEANLKTLIACGVSAGISAIFNAPIAGVLFSLEIILGDFTIGAFTPVVIASVMSAVVAKAYMGERQVFEVPDYQFVNLHELGWYVILAVLSGVVGAFFIWLLYASEDLFNTARVRDARVVKAGPRRRVGRAHRPGVSTRPWCGLRDRRRRTSRTDSAAHAGFVAGVEVAEHIVDGGLGRIGRPVCTIAVYGRHARRRLRPACGDLVARRHQPSGRIRGGWNERLRRRDNTRPSDILADYCGNDGELPPDPAVVVYHGSGGGHGARHQSASPSILSSSGAGG